MELLGQADQFLVQLVERRDTGFSRRDVIEQQPDGGQDIHSLPLQFMNPLSRSGRFTRSFGLRGRKPLCRVNSRTTCNSP